jgi:drug/metabolite transporter (DMT)-like permease
MGTRTEARMAALLVLLSILWGGSFFFTGVALRELPPLTIVLARASIAALLGAAILQASATDQPGAVALAARVPVTSSTRWS